MSTCTIAAGESIDGCQKSFQYFQQAIEDEQTKRDISLQAWTRYRTAYTKWQFDTSVWNATYANYKAKWEAGRTVTGSFIWDGNATADCNNVEKATYKDALGWITYTRNCNDVPNSTAAKCQSCGYYRCDCTAGLDGWCKTSRCNDYKYNSNYSTFPGPTPMTWVDAESLWHRNNPKPVAPTAPDLLDYTLGNGVAWPVFPNIICQSCSQCMNFSNLTADKIDINQLQQSCINKLQMPPPPPPQPVPQPVQQQPAPVYNTPPQPAPAYNVPIQQQPAPAYNVPIQQQPAPVYVPKNESNDKIKLVLLLILLIIVALVGGVMVWYSSSDEPRYQGQVPMYTQYAFQQ
jgi:hypothetical protein